jgi:integrase
MEYLEKAGFRPNAPLFQTFRKKTPTGLAMSRWEAYRMIRRRALDAGVSAPVSCHSFLATGITVYLENKGTVETPQKIAAHESPRATKLYDRTDVTPGIGRLVTNGRKGWTISEEARQQIGAGRVRRGDRVGAF